MVNYIATKLKEYFKKRSAKDLFGDVNAISFLIFFIKANVVGTHWSCIDKLMQFECVPTTYAFIKKQTKIHRSPYITSVN